MMNAEYRMMNVGDFCECSVGVFFYVIYINDLSSVSF